MATTTLHAESIMLIDVEVEQRATGRVTVLQECYDELADWFNETHLAKFSDIDQVLGHVHS